MNEINAAIENYIENVNILIDCLNIPSVDDNNIIGCVHTCLPQINEARERIESLVNNENRNTTDDVGVPEHFPRWFVRRLLRGLDYIPNGNGHNVHDNDMQR